MGYNTEEFLKYSRKYHKKIKALDYLYISHFAHSGDRAKMLETCKENLKHLNTEETISSMIEAIKVIKRNLTIKIGIK